LSWSAAAARSDDPGPCDKIKTWSILRLFEEGRISHHPGVEEHTISIKYQVENGVDGQLHVEIRT